MFRGYPTVFLKAPDEAKIIFATLAIQDPPRSQHRPHTVVATFEDSKVPAAKQLEWQNKLLRMMKVWRIQSKNKYSELLGMASDLIAMASNLIAMAAQPNSNSLQLNAMAELLAMASDLIAMASNLIAMASQPNSNGL